MATSIPSPSVSPRRRILLAISGSIAAYKAADVASQLTAAGCDVRCMLTESASQFVTVGALETLSRHPVHQALFGADISGTEHIRLARWAELIVFVPATAHLMAQLALGMAGDLVTTVALASEAPWLIAPAMNTVMWNQSITRTHREELQSRGARLIEPSTGNLACGEQGTGKLAPPEEIVARVLERLREVPARTYAEAEYGVLPEAGRTEAGGANLSAGKNVNFEDGANLRTNDSGGRRDLEGVRLLITAGPTTSAIDAVRYLTNHSTGQMGAALAEAALARGAQVHYVLGVDKGVVRPQVPRGAEAQFNLVEIQTAEEMAQAALQVLPLVDGIIATAAVLDYRLAESATGKQKRASEALELRLVPSVDVLQELREAARDGQWFFGFAAETDEHERHARAKLEKKRLDYLFANPVARQGERLTTGFGVSTNAGTLYRRDGAALEISVCAKRELADALFDEVVRDLRPSAAAGAKTASVSEDGSAR